MSDSGEAASFAVWKFPLVFGEATVAMPQWAKVIHVGMDPASAVPAIWAVVNRAAAVEERGFAVVGTGHDVPPSCVHLGSVIDREFVWHVFETTPMASLAETLGMFS